MRRRRNGFTLIELLVVILIIVLVSAVTLPVVLPALSHRQVSEAARIVQGSFVGARDAALHAGTSSGIRLLPDPTFPLVYLANGQIDPSQPLAANRIVPIEAAPEYTEGAITWVNPLVIPAGFLPYPCLMVEETVATVVKDIPVPNEPTSWFWNIRVGDKLQINKSGLWYTVIGPMVKGPADGNSELFVNVGWPGTQSPWPDNQAGIPVNPEFLFLVNGLDDNKNGWTDEGFDGVDNNADGIIDNMGSIDPTGVTKGEWEQESWPTGVTATLINQPYTIQRRPSPAANSREISLPTNVVIDLTTWGNAFQERSRFPNGVVNPYTGYVDIMLYPNGTVVPTTIYSTPSSFGMSGAFFHLWLAERSDVAAPNPAALQPPFLPIGNIRQQLVQPGNAFGGNSLKGEYRIVSLFTRTGHVSSSDDPQFDNPVNPMNSVSYNPSLPFLPIQQGAIAGR